MSPAAEPLVRAGDACSRLGEPQKAEVYYRRALEIREQALGPAHKDVATSLSNLAWMYFTQGLFERAEPLYRRALALWRDLGLVWNEAICGIDMATLLDPADPEVCEAADRARAGGLHRLVDRVRELGMEFGLWVEPEMVNPDSDLYRAHPDWAINFPGRPRTEGRNQLILNMARDDVKEHIFGVLDRLSVVLSTSTSTSRLSTARGSSMIGVSLTEEIPAMGAERHITEHYSRGTLLERLAASPDELIAEHARWALDRLNDRTISSPSSVAAATLYVSVQKGGRLPGPQCARGQSLQRIPGSPTPW